MRVSCPCCGEQFPIEDGFADAEGKVLAALFAGLDPSLGRGVLAYLRLFSPAKRGLRTTRAIKLVQELLDLVDSGQVQRDARTNDFKAANPKMWAAGIEQMLQQREGLQLPLDNHNYLRAVVWGIASDPAQVQLARPARKRSGSTVHQDYQEQVGRIESDVLLKIITKEEGQRRLAALGATV